MPKVVRGGDRDIMLNKNKEQAEFYNNPETGKNFPTKIWSYIRNNIIAGGRKELKITQYIYDLHREWLGDLSNKRVLDLGCLRGNALSLEMAQKCKSYLAIDLSDHINGLQLKLVENGLDHAEAKVLDFLSNDFNEQEKFDIIYIYGAMHHFEHFDVFLQRLDEFLQPGGKIIAYDPLETNWLVYLARRIYRPFQNDADWEWPFNRSSFITIQKYFDIVHIQGVLGKSKLIFLFYLFPFFRSYRKKMASKFHQYDISHANSVNSSLFNCMQVAMCLQKKKIN